MRRSLLLLCLVAGMAALSSADVGDLEDAVNLEILDPAFINKVSSAMEAAVSKAKVSKAKVSKPEESKPKESLPEESIAEESKSEESKSEDSKPEESQSEESKPEESQSEESKPEESQSEESMAEESLGKESPVLQLQERITVPDSICLPYLPMIAVDGISLSLYDVCIEGLGSIQLTPPKLPTPRNKTMTLGIKFSSLSLMSGYAAGGRIDDEHYFVGESKVDITVEDLEMSISYVPKRFPLSFCVADGEPTKFMMNIERLFVNFEDLNPGKSESGDEVNEILSSSEDELCRRVESLLNEKYNDLVVTLINALVTKIDVIPGNCPRPETSTNGFDKHGHDHQNSNYKVDDLENPNYKVAAGNQEYLNLVDTLKVVLDLLAHVDPMEMLVNTLVESLNVPDDILN